MLSCVRRRTLQQLGATIGAPTPREFNGLHLDLWPRVSWSPLFALTFNDMEVQPRLASKRLERLGMRAIGLGGLNFGMQHGKALSVVVTGHGQERVCHADAGALRPVFALPMLSLLT